MLSPSTQLNSGWGEANLLSPSALPPTSEFEKALVNAFHTLYYLRRSNWGVQWMGYQMLKWPGDLFIYAELLHKRRPDVLIETGTYLGGSAQYFADCMDRTGHGLVISIDISPGAKRPEHPRVIYLEGDSVAMAEVVKEEIQALETEAGRKLKVMVSLDSDHSKAHVLKELHAYKDIVTEGQYMVVEDTNLSGHPIQTDGLGPWEAVEEFGDARFTIDEVLAKRHLFSWHTWLRKEAL